MELNKAEHEDWSHISKRLLGFGIAEVTPHGLATFSHFTVSYVDTVSPSELSFFSSQSLVIPCGLRF
jgi:hypothetical protein